MFGAWVWWDGWSQWGGNPTIDRRIKGKMDKSRIFLVCEGKWATPPPPLHEYAPVSSDRIYSKRIILSVLKSYPVSTLTNLLINYLGSSPYRYFASKIFFDIKI